MHNIAIVACIKMFTDKMILPVRMYCIWLFSSFSFSVCFRGEFWSFKVQNTALS